MFVYTSINLRVHKLILHLTKMNSTLVFLSVVVALASASQTYDKKVDHPARYRIPAQRRAGYKHGFGTYGGAAGAYGGVNTYGAGNAYVEGRAYGTGNAYVPGRPYVAGNAYVGGRAYGTGNAYGAQFNRGSYQYHGKYGSRNIFLVNTLSLSCTYLYMHFHVQTFRIK